MSLDVQIVGGAGPLTYRLKADSVTIVVDRDPRQAGLPGADPLLIDLGQFKPVIVVEGKVDETASSEGGVTIPSKVNLEDAVRTWYNLNGGVITLTVSGDAYIGKFRSLRMTLPAGRESVWDFTLQFVSKGRS